MLIVLLVLVVGFDLVCRRLAGFWGYLPCYGSWVWVGMFALLWYCGLFGVFLDLVF